jgi:hypothetical protein
MEANAIQSAVHKVMYPQSVSEQQQVFAEPLPWGWLGVYHGLQKIKKRYPSRRWQCYRSSLPRIIYTDRLKDRNWCVWSNIDLMLGPSILFVCAKYITSVSTFAQYGLLFQVAIRLAKYALTVGMLPAFIYPYSNNATLGITYRRLSQLVQYPGGSGK